MDQQYSSNNNHYHHHYTPKGFLYHNPAAPGYFYTTATSLPTTLSSYNFPQGPNNSSNTSGSTTRGGGGGGGGGYSLNTSIPPPTHFVPLAYSQQQFQRSFITTPTTTNHQYHHQQHLPLQQTTSVPTFPPLHVTNSNFPPNYVASVRPPPQPQQQQQSTAGPVRVSHLRATPTSRHHQHHQNQQPPSTNNNTSLGAIINHINQQQQQQNAANTAATALTAASLVSVGPNLQVVQQQLQHHQQQQQQLKQGQVNSGAAATLFPQLGGHQNNQAVVVQGSSNSGRNTPTFVQVYPVPVVEQQQQQQIQQQQQRQASLANSNKRSNNNNGLNYMNAFILKASHIHSAAAMMAEQQRMVLQEHCQRQAERGQELRCSSSGSTSDTVISDCSSSGSPASSSRGCDCHEETLNLEEMERLEKEEADRKDSMVEESSSSSSSPSPSTTGDESLMGETEADFLSKILVDEADDDSETEFEDDETTNATDELCGESTDLNASITVSVDSEVEVDEDSEDKEGDRLLELLGSEVKEKCEEVLKDLEASGSLETKMIADEVLEQTSSKSGDGSEESDVVDGAVGGANVVKEKTKRGKNGKRSPSGRVNYLKDKDKTDKGDPPTIKGYKGEDYYVDERNNTWHFRPVSRTNPVKFIPGGYSPMSLVSACRKRDKRRWSQQSTHADGRMVSRFWGTGYQPLPSTLTEESFSEPPPPLPEDITGIREVWKHNLSIEFQKIRELVKRNYSYIAMDTEFPGVTARPVGEFKTPSEYQYELIRLNCDLLKLIQLGITFLDKDGNFPSGITTWQFNFKFNLREDMYAEDSIKMLTKCGIQFSKHESDGIDPQDFAYYMISSGMVLHESVTWISFHSGYDLGHLYRILTGKKLPKTEQEFFAELKLYFPKIFDVKCLMTACKTMKGGLQECAEILDVERVGYQHQAGSDSYVTGRAFFRMLEVFYDDTDPVSFNGRVFGLDCNYSTV